MHKPVAQRFDRWWISKVKLLFF